MWGEWGFFHEDAWQEPNAVEKYMVTIMYHKQQEIEWVESEESEVSEEAD